MSEIAIRVEGLGKMYRIGKRQASYGSLRDSLAETFAKPFRAARSVVRGNGNKNGNLTSDPGHLKSHFWALRDLSFEVKRGEVLGIIGRNGAGKSTLLKVLSRITDPTAGEVDISGRVGSLLEIGTGFHYDLTGRENVFLNGAILGMKRGEISQKFDEIVAFAEVEEFIDTPVKRYSSGMHMRLAFAVAAFLEPDILLVDEVLAVGDLQFQKKCLGRIGEISNEGRTVVFVSHDMRAIKNLCESGVYLREGRIVARGEIESTVALYAAESESAGPNLPFATKDLIVRGFSISQNSIRCAHIDGSLPFEINADFEIKRDLKQFRLGIYLKSSLGDTIARSFLADWNPERETFRSGHYAATLSVPAKLLSPGSYSVVLHASRYGLEDYLSAADIRRDVTISAPTSFNSAHPGEKIESILILRDGWNIHQQTAGAI
jgi:lipopolysaccharide transport system ATP-binding protein